jgi:hypothetical protein
MSEVQGFVMKVCTSFAYNMLCLKILARFRTTGYMWSLSEIYTKKIREFGSPVSLERGEKTIQNQVKFN